MLNSKETTPISWWKLQVCVLKCAILSETLYLWKNPKRKQAKSAMCHKTFAIFMKFHEAKDCGIPFVLLLVYDGTLILTNWNLLLRVREDLNDLNDSMISPILTYNSEVWDAFAESDLKSWDSSAIEKTHLQFCKGYLEVHNKASNIACRADLGKFPLNIDINKRKKAL